jgi:cellulose biosynthesis protein BcsQ
MGGIWERRPTLAPPLFRPLRDRRVPIISIVNLKGGVGKTTVTANLGATLWTHLKLRVLLIDLDFQGSLTSRCLLEQPRQQLRATNRYIQEFFRNGERSLDDLRRYITPITYADKKIQKQLVERAGEGGHIIAADEALADVETFVMVQWWLSQQNKTNAAPDIRFLLRQALHGSDLSKSLDFVLIDCPPRLTTACINALACSDFVLIPVLLDSTSTEAVPRMLEWLRRLKDANVCPNLSVLGILANRVNPAVKASANPQRLEWDSLPNLCDQYCLEGFGRLDTQIWDDARVADAAREHWPGVLRDLGKFGDLQTNFRDLVTELFGRIQRHDQSSRGSTVSEQPGKSTSDQRQQPTCI